MLKVKELRAHQIPADEKFKNRDLMGLFLEMRLGKTILTTHWFNHLERRLGRRLKILIIAPKTPLVSWCDEIPGAIIVKGTPEQRRAIIKGKAGVYLITPQSAVTMPTLAHAGWDVVGCDESTFLKNPKTPTYKRLTRYFKAVQHKFILTGLPNPQNNLEIWPQMAWLHGGKWLGFSNFWSFRKVHCRRFGFDWKLTPTGQALIEKQITLEGYTRTRKQAGVGNPKVRIKLYGDMDKDTRAIYAKAVRKWEIPGLWCKNSIVTAGWLHRMCGGYLPSRQLPCWKYERILQLLQTKLRNRKVVLWFAYNRELARCYKTLRRAGIRCGWITGKVSSVEDRQRRVAIFRDSPQRVILLQEKCAKFGLNLSCSDIAIYFSQCWSNETRRQTEDRIENTAKKRFLYIIDLITRNSPDEDVIDTLTDHNARTEDFVSAIRRRANGFSSDKEKRKT